MTDIRCIGIGTGGGDAPGLNAVIRAVVKAAIHKYHWKVIGIPDGFDGLIWPERAVQLTLKSVSGILPRGGTIDAVDQMKAIDPRGELVAAARAIGICFGA